VYTCKLLSRFVILCNQIRRRFIGDVLQWMRGRGCNQATKYVVETFSASAATKLTELHLWSKWRLCFGILHYIRIQLFRVA